MLRRLQLIDVTWASLEWAYRRQLANPADPNAFAFSEAPPPLDDGPLNDAGVPFAKRSKSMPSTKNQVLDWLKTYERCGSWGAPDAMLLTMKDSSGATHMVWHAGVFGRLLLTCDVDSEASVMDSEAVVEKLLDTVKVQRSESMYPSKRPMPRVALVERMERRPLYGRKPLLCTYVLHVGKKRDLGELERAAARLTSEWEFELAERPYEAPSLYLEKMGATYGSLLDVWLTNPEETVVLFDPEDLYEDHQWISSRVDDTLVWDGLARCPPDPRRNYEWLAGGVSLVPGERDALFPTLQILSFDIETIDHKNPNVVPMPCIDKTPNSPRNDDSQIYAIALVMKPANRRLLLLLRQKGHTFEADKLGYEGQVQVFRSEKELLNAFGSAIRQWDPDVITGYNVNGYDWPWVMKRATHAHCNPLFFHMSRFGGSVKLRSKQFDSGAVGQTDSYEVQNMMGRILYDLLPVAKKELPRLRSYRLDAVGKEVLGEGKEDLSYAEQRECYLEGTTGSIAKIAK